jgi:hypothetical protein
MRSGKTLVVWALLIAAFVAGFGGYSLDLGKQQRIADRTALRQSYSALRAASEVFTQVSITRAEAELMVTFYQGRVRLLRLADDSLEMKEALTWSRNRESLTAKAIDARRALIEILATIRAVCSSDQKVVTAIDDIIRTNYPSFEDLKPPTTNEADMEKWRLRMMDKLKKFVLDEYTSKLEQLSSLVLAHARAA